MRIFFIVVAGLLTTAIGRGQDTDQLHQLVQAYADRGWFMGSVLVARGDQVLLSKGYGSANLEWGIPIDPATKFRISSLTKQFTAAAILLLEERGKLSIDDPVKKYLPDVPATWDNIRIFHLLTHSSGIPNYTSFADYGPSRLAATTPEKLVARFRDKPLEFDPGEKWNYSNSGYALLGYLIEKISGESYADFVRKNIFVPLAMNDSGYDSAAAIIPHRASGYAPGPNGPRNADYIDPTVTFAAGALYSTTIDLWKWEQGLFGGKLVSPTSLKKMTTPFLHEYGFGVGIGTRKGVKVVAHLGGIEGFSTYLAYFPDERLAVIALGNLSGTTPETIIHALSAVLHGEPAPALPKRAVIVVPEAVLGKYAGTYDLNPQENLTLTVEGGKLMAQPNGGPKFPLLAETEKIFFTEAVDAQVEFMFDASGDVTSLVLHQGRQQRPARKR